MKKATVIAQMKTTTNLVDWLKEQVEDALYEILSIRKSPRVFLSDIAELKQTLTVIDEALNDAQLKNILHDARSAARTALSLFHEIDGGIINRHKSEEVAEAFVSSELSDWLVVHLCQLRFLIHRDYLYAKAKLNRLEGPAWDDPMPKATAVKGKRKRS